MMYMLICDGIGSDFKVGAGYLLQVVDGGLFSTAFNGLFVAG
jgi:hypothetical protein